MTVRTSSSKDVGNRPLHILNAISVVIIVGVVVFVALAMGACQSGPRTSTHTDTRANASTAPSVALRASAPVIQADITTACREILYPPAWHEASACIQAWHASPTETALCVLHYGPDAVGEDRLAAQHTRRLDTEDCLGYVTDGDHDFGNQYSELKPSTVVWTADGFTLGAGGCGINIRGIDGGPTC